MSAYDTLQQAFLEHRRTHGILSARRLIAEHGGNESLDSVEESRWDSLARAFGKVATDDDGTAGPGSSMLTDGELDATKIYAKYNSAGGRKQTAE